MPFPRVECPSTGWCIRRQNVTRVRQAQVLGATERWYLYRYRRRFMQQRTIKDDRPAHRRAVHLAAELRKTEAASLELFAVPYGAALDMAFRPGNSR